MESGGFQAYGAGMAASSGGPFDFVTFIRKPTVVLRIITVVLTIIVWSCISNSSLIINTKEECLVGGFCTFGQLIAFLSLAASVGFLVGGFFALMFVIMFIGMWASYAGFNAQGEVYSSGPPCAAIFFSLLLVGSWGGIAFFGWRRYQEGANTSFAPSYEQEFGAGGVGGVVGPPPGGADYGYGGAPGVGGMDSYQDQPFTASNQAAGLPAYQQQPY